MRDRKQWALLRLRLGFGLFLRGSAAWDARSVPLNPSATASSGRFFAFALVLVCSYEAPPRGTPIRFHSLRLAPSGYPRIRPAWTGPRRRVILTLRRSIGHPGQSSLCGPDTRRARFMFAPPNGRLTRLRANRCAHSSAHDQAVLSDTPFQGCIHPSDTGMYAKASAPWKGVYDSAAGFKTIHGGPVSEPCMAGQLRSRQGLRGQDGPIPGRSLRMAMIAARLAQ